MCALCRYSKELELAQHALDLAQQRQAGSEAAQLAAAADATEAQLAAAKEAGTAAAARKKEMVDQAKVRRCVLPYPHPPYPTI